MERIRSVSAAMEQNGTGVPTVFEAATAMAFLHFQQRQCDVVLLETGISGRLDATNIIEQPIACIVTPIGFDHMDKLGGTLAEIAMEKAGIIKANCPVVIAEQTPEIRDESFCAGHSRRPLAGKMADKDYVAMMQSILPMAKCVYTITPPSHRALSAEQLADCLRMECRAAVPVKPFGEIGAALTRAVHAAGEDIVCAFGSLYYVGLVREWAGNL